MELFSVFGRRPLRRIHHLTGGVGPCTSEWPVEWSGAVQDRAVQWKRLRPAWCPLRAGQTRL